MIAENVYSIFKALSPVETKRFLEMIAKEKKRAAHESQNNREKIELKEYCDRIVHDYLSKLKRKCLAEMEQYYNRKSE